MLGFSIVLPFLVFLVTRWGGNALVYGLIGATYSAFQFVGAPVLGRWSDRFGRKRVLLLSQLGTLVSWLIFLVAFFLPTTSLAEVSSHWLGRFTVTLPLVILFIARAADGLTGGNVSVANAYLADVTPEDQRNASFGKMAVSTNLGFIVGPAIAGLLGATVLGELLPVVLATAISLVATLLIAFRLEESNPCALSSEPGAGGAHQVLGRESRPCIEHGESLRARQILALPRVPSLLVIHFLVMLAFNFFYVAFPIHVTRQLGWVLQDTGAFFATWSLIMVLVQGPVLSRVSKVCSEELLVKVGGAVLGVGFLAFTQASTYVIYAGAALLALGNGVMWPSLVSLLSKRAGQHQGAVQGFSGSSGAVASILGLLAGGLVYEVVQELVFVICALVVLTTAAMSLSLLRAEK